MTPELPDDLLTRWPLDQRLGRELIDRWREPHRRYHTIEHLAAVLDTIDRYAPAASDPAAVRLAAWFHDAIYAPQRPDNEEASAALAAETLPHQGLLPEQVEEVRRLVLLTRGHDVEPDDSNGALLCDADLLILASPPDTYASYVLAVRQEYSYVPEPDFRTGRGAVLRGLLELPKLYRLMPFKVEEAARANLIAELDSYPA